MSCFRSRPGQLIATIAVLALLFFTFSLPSAQQAQEWTQQIQSKLTWSKNDLEQVPKHLRDVYNSTLGFEKVFVINLPSRTDYRDSLSIAGASTGIKLDWIDAVKGESVDPRVLPPGGEELTIEPGKRGCWRSHMNALTKIVEDDIASALIIEGDADWDVRIKSEMFNFAKASNMLLQPLASSSEDSPEYADPTYRNTQHKDGEEIDFHFPPSTKPPTSGSPYGDGWDMLWIGHCGTHFPNAQDTPDTPRGRVIQTYDPTVPEYRHFTYYFERERTVKTDYHNHTRFYFHTRDNVCTIAYAISNLGARRLLFELGIRKFNAPSDIMHRNFCDGRNGRGHHTCLTVIPELFQSHRPAGKKAGQSDISANTMSSEKINNKAFTSNIRFSARMNMQKLVDGLTDYIDQYPDTKRPKKDGNKNEMKE